MEHQKCQNPEIHLCWKFSNEYEGLGICLLEVGGDSFFKPFILPSYNMVYFQTGKFGAVFMLVS